MAKLLAMKSFNEIIILWFLFQIISIEESNADDTVGNVVYMDENATRPFPIAEVTTVNEMITENPTIEKPIQDLKHENDLEVKDQSLKNATLTNYNLKQKDIKGCRISDETTQFSDGMENLKRASCKYDNYLDVCYPPGCAEAMKDIKKTNRSGLYKIQTAEASKPFFVYCLEDPNDPSRPWLVIQRRQNGRVNFNRKWAEYQKGFGNLEDEFFRGLDYLHEITWARKHELLITVKEYGRKTVIRTSKYKNFVIGGEELDYALLSLGEYEPTEGDAGDCFSKQGGMKFSTPDRRNDEDNGICKNYPKTAWWYRSCAYSNLNGPYKIEKYYNSTAYVGIIWYPMTYFSLQYAQMAIRPVIS